MKNLKDINASNYCITKEGQLYSLRCSRFMKGWMGTDYWRNNITWDDGSDSQMSTHRLVALAYLDNPENKPQVNHIDGDKLNNNVDNLEWCTPSENLQHAYDTNLTCGKKPNKEVPTLKGSYREVGSLNEELVHEICKLISEGYRDVDISRMLDSSRRNINKLRHKKEDYWKYITSQYSYKFKKEERMSPERVLQVCNLLSKGSTVVETHRELGLNRKQVGNIKNRKTFKDISSYFTW